MQLERLGSPSPARTGPPAPGRWFGFTSPFSHAKGRSPVLKFRVRLELCLGAGNSSGDARAPLRLRGRGGPTRGDLLRAAGEHCSGGLRAGVEAGSSRCRSGASGGGPRPRPLAERRQEELHSPIHLLCQALRHPGSNARALRLWWCGLSGPCCAELAALLAQHPSLARLELGDGTLGDGGVRLLCEGLRQPGCRLRVLRLRYSRLTSACCEDLAAALGASPCLEELDLSFSEGLRDAGVQLLCEGLRHHACRLQTLRLGSCRLTGACCQALAARLVESPRLACLDLSDNELGADGVLQLCQQLRHPACSLRALGLSTSALSEEALQELAALRALKPDLKIGYLLEQDVPQAGAMARLPFRRGVLPGAGGPGGRRVLPSFRRAPLL
ncbi:hypothetical protein QYF61_019938 [Mycteria americana]|uniref:Uncharacterized protein n=1 Tax=Mycteria americana TaxID=33587 RepID=A0AAN7NBY0_MYCAM|nr:hypothetical protein QYF61_019938 [Mycteria americana]